MKEFLFDGRHETLNGKISLKVCKTSHVKVFFPLFSVVCVEGLVLVLV